MKEEPELVLAADSKQYGMVQSEREKAIGKK